ncbi:DNA helicase [Sporosarcina sp. NCCP-2222]|uniref:UvrD-helicase domain-containing protein n=1 Tax=Sporosarcina sp. NCCP-2222 TaxID=2935073 RepID=UPI0020817F4F|nr:UvrD-helicase domain-containing protein [Sporosarcina sp. NCCP-2222]GKV57023.1 DNA helicase [Sporosarcina sp. NCCP-2222]
MKVKEEDYKLVESILLDKKGEFNSLQRKFIELTETKTIIAGPGAGKTTTLAAKIVIFLKNLKATNSKDGVCIITHTNVAVNEINSALLKAGVGTISHPHFIGTIHEFFNRYCVFPYFKYKYKHNDLLFDNEGKSDLEYYKTFVGIKKPWINQDKFKRFRDSLPERISKSELFVNEDNKLNLYNTTKWDKFESYRELMLDAKMSRKLNGLLTYDDTFLFSEIFLAEDRFKEVLRKRFKYIFLDEFQDTHPKGMNLLEKLFNTPNNVFQKIGDPYQTITFNQQMPIVREEDIFRINITNRFGSEIAEHLNVIMPESQMQSIHREKKSFTPIILLYKDKNDIYNTYKDIIQEHEELDANFKGSNKRDKVLVLERKWASDVKAGSKYKQKKQKRLLSKNEALKTTIFDFVIKRIINEGGNLLEVKKWLNNHSQVLSLNKLLIKIIKGNIDEEKVKLKNLINSFLEERGSTNITISNNLFEKLKDITIDNEVWDVKIDDEDDIFTIHSVKGETLRSVLLVDYEAKHLTNVLLHKYGIFKEGKYQFTHQNLLYVAMSRVTHLFVFAIEESDLTSEARAALEQKWRIVEIKSTVEV